MTTSAERYCNEEQNNKKMATRYYITFHSSTYDTTKRYSSCLQILSKDNLVAIGQDIALKIPMSWSKEKMADYISSYVVSHPEEMVSILDDEEIVLAHDIISGGKGNVLWKRHLLKYHHLKCMVCKPPIQRKVG